MALKVESKDGLSTLEMVNKRGNVVSGLAEAKEPVVKVEGNGHWLRVFELPGPSLKSVPFSRMAKLTGDRPVPPRAAVEGVQRLSWGTPSLAGVDPPANFATLEKKRAEATQPGAP
jgi:hypothetical protein